MIFFFTFWQAKKIVQTKCSSTTLSSITNATSFGTIATVDRTGNARVTMAGTDERGDAQQRWFSKTWPS